MKTAYWFLFLVLANTLHLYFFFHLEAPLTLIDKVFIGFHLLGTFGVFWMLRDWFIRKKRKWKPFMWLVFVPWSFVWYYFEVYRVEPRPDAFPTAQ